MSWLLSEQSAQDIIQTNKSFGVIASFQFMFVHAHAHTTPINIEYLLNDIIAKQSLLVSKRSKQLANFGDVLERDSNLITCEL